MHKNNMTAWPEITCQRGHQEHITRPIEITIGGPTAYTDMTPIPEQFARGFKMSVYDPDRYPVDGGPYCPAHDAVSETIVSHGIWEPRETTLALSVFASASEGAVVFDMGAQIGWYSLLAASSGLRVHAYEADGANLAVLRGSVQANGWEDLLIEHPGRIDRETPEILSQWRRPDLPALVRFAKLDLEGAEIDALRVLWPLIPRSQIDHLMVEVSPVFDDYYPALVAKLIDAGYEAYRLPPKQRPPVVIGNDLAQEMEPYRISAWPKAQIADWVANCGQEDVWFRRIGASW